MPYGRAFLALACALSAAAACAGPGDEQPAVRGDTGSVQAGATAAASTPTTQSGLADAQTQSFDRFWAAFRQAVLVGDKTSIASVTRFPFETRGVSDDDPVKKYDRAAFSAVLDTLLAQRSDEGREDETVRQFVTRTTTLPPRTLGDSGNDAAVGPFSFVRSDGRWQLTRVYTTE